MNHKFTYGSVCSGIEAVTCAWHDFATPLWFSEIEPFPCAVLSHHFPAVPNLGDMTALPGKILNREVPVPDVLVGGTPCQAFSVAGLRLSLDDERGNLTLTLIRILEAVDYVRYQDGREPCILMWENVPGVLSTKDNAFGHLLAGLAQENKPLQPAGKQWSGAGYVHAARTITWRTLDAQYFGLAQRRKRVFLMAGAGARSTAQILIERKSLFGDITACGNPQQTSASFTESSFGTYSESTIAGPVRAHGGTLSGGSETLIMHGTQDPAIPTKSAVRRLTPTECERLQGFPDNWTKVPYHNNPAENCPDSLRYKAIGNSMAVPVVRWIGKRLGEYIGHPESQRPLNIC